MNEISDQVVGILEPVIGPGLAASAVSLQCRKMGIMTENLSRDNLVEFADRFRVPIQYFAGEAAADEIVRRMKDLK
jgi:hypothetical protein